MALCSYAQKTVKFDYQTSQARVLDVNPSTYVKPLVAEVIVDSSKGRIRDSWILTSDELAARLVRKDVIDDASIQNLRSYAVFKSSEKHNCDLIIAATFDIHITENGAEVSVVGYPANFANWSTGVKADYDWITIEKNIDTIPVPTEKATDSKTKK